MLELIVISTLNGVLFGMLLFLMASGLTLIFSMMGVLNFAHASIYMIGAYLAFTVSQFTGFFPALIIAPILCGLLGAAIEVWGLRRAHGNGHIAELLFTFGLVFIIQRVVQMTWGMLPMAYRVPALLDFPLFTFYGQHFPAYRGFMLLVSAGMLLATWLLLKKTRVGLIIQASLTHPQMVSALGHNVPMVFTLVFAGGCMPLCGRPDWRPASGKPGSDLGMLQRGAFDQLGASHAICNVLYGASAVFDPYMSRFFGSALDRHLGRVLAAMAGPTIQPVLHGFAVMLIFWFILFGMYRRSIFLKI